LPHRLFLSIPWIGCFLVLGLVAWVVWRETRSLLLAAVGTALMATLSWFFVSTGWLAYFDSWYVLAMLLVALADSPALLLSTALVSPWIDERFIVSLPLCLLVRRQLRASRGAEAGPSVWKICALGVLPYLLARLVALLISTDPVPNSYYRLVSGYPHDPFRRLEALWQGLRAAWVFVVFFLWHSGRSRGARERAFLLAVVAGSAAASLWISFDMSRTISILAPAVLGGVILALRDRPGSAGYAMVAVLLANLVLPASQVTTRWVEPIYTFPTQYSFSQRPPFPYLTPDYFSRRATERWGNNDPRGALSDLNLAMQLGPKEAGLYYKRALASWKLGDAAGASADLEASLELEPRFANAYYARAAIRQQQGDEKGAIADGERALQCSPPAWPRAEKIRRFLASHGKEKLEL
jgi:hypothetical protein